ncbi:cyclin-dependent kinase inhibitor 3 isoform X4 [Tympanuchus pallidicinctus]|uniref:cyclin-dependent kinase inhibitor 3 isoform X4 n=1 Tax=Tympanuchus pallidicinctus TaxID=109042 RepID=UPI002286FCB5|nr:cyclin-dependent kinase inhibitor 3 isoform X4 [Tympanuchus pallidicinctus]
MHVAGFDSSDEEAAEEEEGEEPAPLPLSWLPLPPAYSSAFLAVCSLPGCRFKDIRRNLQKDIDELKSCGTQDVFVLCTKGELLKYRVPNLIDAYQERGICVHHYPIPDGDAPDVTTCCTILEELRSCLESNRKTIIHSCMPPASAFGCGDTSASNRQPQRIKGISGDTDSQGQLEQSHRTARVGRDLKDHEAPTPLCHAGPPTSPFHSSPGCPGPHPTWP